jgi:hypothetical protein
MTKRALIVAIDDFRYQKDLSGPVRSGNAWKTYFLSKGYTVTTLTNSQATHSAIISKLNSLSLLTKAYDTFVFVYLGHGGQITDKNADEPDKLDECIAAYNTTLLGSYLIKDDAIVTALSKTHVNATVECIFDCCHSGTMCDQNRVPRFTTWAACLPTQLSHTGSYPEGSVAVFSYCLQFFLDDAPTATRQQLVDAINSTILGWGPLWDQTAQIEGTLAKKGGLPFTA